MSSTNRGSERVEKDSYPTPAWCVERLIEYTRPVGNVWLEPCVGDGAIARVLTRLLNAPRMLIGIDVRDTRANALASGCTSFVQANYLTFVPLAEPLGGVDSIITNPPYSLSFDICQRAITQAPWVALLLPLNFAASAKRCAWFQANTPSVLVLPDRPNFVRCYSCPMCGKKWVEAIDQERKTKCIDGCSSSEKLQICESDSTDYGWFIWDGKPAKFVVLNTTPLEVRRPNGRSK